MTETDDIEQRIEETLAVDEKQETLPDEEAEIIHKHGIIKFKYIDAPPDSVWFTRPQALNYFKNGILYRTKQERSSGKTELFLDLLYVGIVANIAGEATEKADGLALVKYILLFMPYWTVWADIKDFTNYYYVEDVSQKAYIFWVLCLLTLSVNSHGELTESRKGAAFTIVPYILCRFSLASAELLYSFFISEHRAQQRLYSVFLMITCCIWIPVIFVTTRVKIAISCVAIVLEQISYSIVYHPRTTRLMNLKAHTALNIEHEIDRYNAFFTVACGEFLYVIVAEGDSEAGFTTKFARAVLLLATAYSLFWIYQARSITKSYTHPLRHSVSSAMAWLYIHIPLIGAVILSADAGGKLMTREKEVPELVKRAEEGTTRGLAFMFTGGICTALFCMHGIALLEKSRDSPGTFIVGKFWRTCLRTPAGIVILCLAIKDMDSTLLMGMTTMITVLVVIYESIVSVPRKDNRFKWTSGND